MPDNDDYLRLRRMSGEVDSDTYTDADLQLFLNDAGNDLTVAAALVWRQKAASYADLVDISEAGSSRKNSDLYRNAKAEAERLEQLSVTTVELVAGATTTRRIVRG